MPHVCGDEPGKLWELLGVASVCPTYVGMNRSIKFLDTAYDCMPHVCGDEPMIHIYVIPLHQYAPRMWG